MALTEIVIRQAKAGEKPRKMADGKGLYLLLTPAGGKLWRVDYRHLGKRGTLALGQWPDMPLVGAREKRDEVRKALEAGIDPGLEKQRKKAREKLAAGDTFAAIAAEYIDKKRREGAASATLAKMEYLAAQLTPAIRAIPVAKLTPADILGPLRKVERKGNLHSAGRCLQFTGQVLRYAVATARLTSDPSRDLRGALEAPKVKHRAAITDPVKLGRIDIQDSQGV